MSPNKCALKAADLGRKLKPKVLGMNLNVLAYELVYFRLASVVLFWLFGVSRFSYCKDKSRVTGCLCETVLKSNTKRFYVQRQLYEKHNQSEW